MKNITIFFSCGLRPLLLRDCPESLISSVTKEFKKRSRAKFVSVGSFNLEGIEFPPGEHTYWIRTDDVAYMVITETKDGAAA